MNQTNDPTPTSNPIGAGKSFACAVIVYRKLTQTAERFTVHVTSEWDALMQGQARLGVAAGNVRTVAFRGVV
jgi:hypothetical protein